MMELMTCPRTQLLVKDWIYTSYFYQRLRRLSSLISKTHILSGFLSASFRSISSNISSTVGTSISGIFSNSIFDGITSVICVTTGRVVFTKIQTENQIDTLAQIFFTKYWSAGLGRRVQSSGNFTRICRLYNNVLVLNWLKNADFKFQSNLVFLFVVFGFCERASPKFEVFWVQLELEELRWLKDGDTRSD